MSGRLDEERLRLLEELKAELKAEVRRLREERRNAGKNAPDETA